MSRFTAKPLTWFALKLLLAFWVPALAYVWITQSVLKNHTKTLVTNDPEENLARSLSTLLLSLEGRWEDLSSKAASSAGNNSLAGSLTPPLDLPAFQALGQALSSGASLPLFVLTDSKGGVLYDTLGLPRPTPTPGSASNVKKSKKRSKRSKTVELQEPPLFSVKDWPGLPEALKGSSQRAILGRDGLIYRTVAVPVLSKGEVAGVLVAGTLLDDAFARQMREAAQNDVAFFLGGKLIATTFPDSAKNALERWAAPNKPPGIDKFGPLVVNSQKYFLGTYRDFPQNPGECWVVFQPLKQSVIVSGDPGKVFLRYGVGLLLVLLAATAWLSGSLFLSLGRVVQAVEGIKRGDWNVSLPAGRFDALGALAVSLQEMRESLQEKDRVSLVLGKVVSPQVARNVLTARDQVALKGERRECAILYADLRGFNLLGENLAPEALVEALNRYFSLINEAVFNHEGMLDKFVGEAAIAVWGAPVAQEDKELRAVEAALEIQELLREFNVARIQKNLPSFSVGVGIHVGEVVSGNLGSEKRNDYTILGPTLEIARKLCAKASPGQIIVSEGVHLKTQPRLKVTSLGSLAVSDREEALPIYEVFQFV